MKSTDHPTSMPEWNSPRTPQPREAIQSESKLNIAAQAQAIVGSDATPEILAAVIVAQALDRLGEKLFEAAIAGRCRG